MGDPPARGHGGRRVETPIGRLPVDGDLNVDGLDLAPEQLAELFAVEPKTWLDEAELTEQYYEKFGSHVPAELRSQLSAMRERLEAAADS